MPKKKLLIVGAGEAAELLLRDIKKNSFLQYWVVGFVDDFKEKGSKIQNIEVLGKIEDIPEIFGKNPVEEIIIAIPSLGRERLKQIISVCSKTNAETKILPSTYESTYSLKTGRPWYEPVRKIELTDLLKRKPVLISYKELESYISKKTILVTGGGGSIGSEIVRQIAQLNPSNLIVVDNSEYNLYKIDLELRHLYEDKLNFHSSVTDIKDLASLKHLMQKHRPEIIFHAAAYKHVPLMEFNAGHAVKNNIFGTHNLMQTAYESNVKDFVLISTDKSVKPQNIMGATKKITELLMHFFPEGKTKFSAVRFGNVLGSAGSVIPFFEEQIRKGGPITITHPDITRYFMTIPEASQLVIQSGTLSNHKQISILDMGEPYKVIDLARDLIRLHGLIPEKDIKFKFIGLRPGEKLYEELSTEKEILRKSKHDRIFFTELEPCDIIKLRKNILDLKSLINRHPSDAKIKERLLEIINGSTI